MTGWITHIITCTRSDAAHTRQHHHASSTYSSVSTQLTRCEIIYYYPLHPLPHEQLEPHPHLPPQQADMITGEGRCGLACAAAALLLLLVMTDERMAGWVGGEGYK
jgi:hypothetical protein